MMLGVQQKRKSSDEQEACLQQQQQQQPHQQLKRRRGKAAVASLREAKDAIPSGTGSDESVWIFGLINNIEQLLFNVAASGTSGSPSSGSSTPSSTTSTSTVSSPSSSLSSSSSMIASAPIPAAASCGAHHQVPRSPISRQIKFHEYKGPPAAKRQAPATGAGSNRSLQKTGSQVQLQAQTLAATGARCKAPSRSQQQHLATHAGAAARPAQQPHQQQKLSPVQQQQPTRTIAKHQPHQSPQQQARHQQSAQNQLTSAAIASSAPNSNATFSALSPAAVHLQPQQQQQQQQIVYGSADTSQTAIEQPKQCAQHQVMASQTPTEPTRCLEQQQQQQLGDFELAMLQLASAAAVDDDHDNHQDKLTRGPNLGPVVPDQVEACQLEPSIASFACSGVEELLFSEFIDLQDVPMNVDESDWLRKFLPPCNSLGSR